MQFSTVGRADFFRLYQAKIFHRRNLPSDRVTNRVPGDKIITAKEKRKILSSAEKQNLIKILILKVHPFWEVLI